MYIILGGTGHVGSATAKALLDKGEPVTIVTRDAEKAKDLETQGAKIAVADVHDPNALRAVLQTGKRLFLLNPPADPAGDTDAEEHKTIRALLTALEGSDLEKIVAQSTYGAQPGEEIGDLGTLYALEEGLRGQLIPASIIRAAYYMTNWNAMLGSAREERVIYTMFPADLKIPMVAPDDMGRAAADLLTSPVERTDTYSVEGPERYSADDVAAAFSKALGNEVKAEVVPREGWEASFKSLGFSDEAAKSYAGMIGVSVDGGFDLPTAPIKGLVTIQSYIDRIVAASS